MLSLRYHHTSLDQRFLIGGTLTKSEASYTTLAQNEKPARKNFPQNHEFASVLCVCRPQGIPSLHLLMSKVVVL